MAAVIKKAERHQAKLRLGLAAPSGGGKTYSALLLAFGIGGKIGIIDTEHKSGSLYAHLGDYDTIEITAPYTVAKYLEAVAAYEQAGYDVVIIDSLSHAWAGDGGLLDKQGKLADRGTNSFAAWRTITPEHNRLVDSMLKSPCHIIATMRSKVEYVLETNDKGKQQPKKMGLAPVQREGMDYEFTVMLDIDQHHIASASKDRTGLFDSQYFMISKDTGKQLKQWLETGSEAPAEPPPQAEPTQSTPAHVEKITKEQVKTLASRLEETGVPLEALLTKANTKTLSDIDADKFDAAHTWIGVRHSKMKEKAAKDAAAAEQTAETTTSTAAQE